MAFPKGIARRKKVGPGKLEKELRLFYVLYTDWLYTNHRASKEKTGAPMEELWRLIAPDAQESAFRRMLDRYLLELKQCGAICGARTSRDGYCTAQFDEPGLSAEGEYLNDIHLGRLARTTALMRRFLDMDLPAGYGLWSYDLRFYSRVFFASFEEMLKWYDSHFHMDDTRRRTMQRDMETVWRVIRQLRTEG